MVNPRLQRFHRWFEQTFGPLDSTEARAKFTKASGQMPGFTKLTKGRVSQLLNQTEGKQDPFGLEAAERMGVRFGLGPTFFLTDLPDSVDGEVPVVKLSPEAVRFATRYDRLSPREQLRLEWLFEGARDHPAPREFGDASWGSEEQSSRQRSRKPRLLK